MKSKIRPVSKIQKAYFNNVAAITTFVLDMDEELTPQHCAVIYRNLRKVDINSWHETIAVANSVRQVYGDKVAGKYELTFANIRNAVDEAKIILIKRMMADPMLCKSVVDSTINFSGAELENGLIGDDLEKKFKKYGGSDDSESGQGHFYIFSGYAQKVVEYLTNTYKGIKVSCKFHDPNNVEYDLFLKVANCD